MSKKENFKLDVISGIDDDIIEDNSKKRILLWRKTAAKKSFKKLSPLISAAASFLIIVVIAVLFIRNGGGQPVQSDTFIPSASEKQVPIYQGMTVSTDNIMTVAAPHDSKTSVLSYGYVSSIYNDSVYDNDFSVALLGADDPDTSTSSDDTIENDTSLPEISGGPYYAEAGEDIYILVHISNPDGFEILSFTLNGEKYSSYMFEKGSGLETLVLKYNVGDIEGLMQYTIDAIKYIDGDVIKDVRMEGDKTVEVLVGSDSKTVSFNANFEGWELNISPIWDDTFGGEKKFATLSVHDGDTKIRELSPDATVISGLPMDSRLLLVATYLDENGETVTVRKVIHTPKQSEGLLVIDGKIMGIGTCSDTVLYINMPVGESAFANNPHIEKVYLGSGATSIEDYAFSHCSSLDTVILSDGVRSIGDCLFTYVPLKTITIPNTVTYIGYYTAAYPDPYRSSLESIYFTGTMSQWDEIKKHPSWENSGPGFGWPGDIICTDGVIKR